MSTRGVIARKTATGFEGRYHHSDSYCSGLGEGLYKLYNGHFERDMKAMLKVLLDDHPAGWSFILDCDFSLEPGWSRFYDFPDFPGSYDEWQKTEDGRRPQCYCHGGRHEEATPFITENSDLSWLEYIYVLDEETHSMDVYANGYSTGRELLATVDLHDPEPNWGDMKTEEEREAEREAEAEEYEDD